jgi:GPH family glycoside/pentoside/hexuronide:cation symporter
MDENHNLIKKERPSLRQIILFSLGQLGYSLASFSAINLLVFFYMPPETGGETIFPQYIYTGAVFGVLTLLGVLNFGSRIFDAITDPMIAFWSDKSNYKLGKRKTMLLIASLPFALFSFLVFYPVSESFAMNGYWLAFCLFALYLFMTMYTVPYNALISELGHQKEDRLRISTAISLTWALGFVIGNLAYSLPYLFVSNFGYTESGAFQLVVGIFAVFSFLCLLSPVFFLDEHKYAVQNSNETNWRISLKMVMRDKNFRIFYLADTIFWFSLNMIQIGIAYYVTLIFEMDKSMATTFMMLAFFSSLALYYPIGKLAKRFGKKKVILSSLICFAITFLMLFAVDYLPNISGVLFYVLALGAAFPLGVMGILPNALIADIIHDSKDAQEQALSGMYYAIRNMMTKFGVSFANLVFPSLLLLGNSIDNPFGVKLSALVAMVFCLIGWVVLKQFKEPAKA